MQQKAPLVKLVITTGEPAGVGPEVSFSAALNFLNEQANAHITLLGDINLLKSSQVIPAKLVERLHIESTPLAESVDPGILNPANARYVLSLLDQASDGCMKKRFDAMITAPVQKSVINIAGIPFTGHTEYLAERCNTKHVVMMLCALLPLGFLGLKTSRDLRVALFSTHLPLKEVSAALSIELILETIQIVDQDLKSGYLGQEEIESISPAIKLAKEQGIEVSGPYPGDTMFDARALEKVDAFIAMYHDQGLAPFKFVTFGGGVNVTLGLPFIRTSVDHGTALDIAGKGIAESGSMLEALRLAYQLALNQRKLT